MTDLDGRSAPDAYGGPVFEPVGEFVTQADIGFSREVVYACEECGALVGQSWLERHSSWHLGGGAPR